MKIELTDKPVEELESSSQTRGQARRKARRSRRSGSTTTRSPGATNRPKAEKKPTQKPATKTPRKPKAKAPRAGSKAPAKPRAPKAAKQHKVPNAVELLVQRSKPKLRIKHSEPGRYVLVGRGVQYALVRVKEQTKYTPSMGQKLFTPKGLESTSSADADSPDWDVIGLDEITSESIADLELEYEMELDAFVYGEEADLESDSAKAPGARNNQAGNKLGRKKRAPNMLAPGWHMLKKGSDGKITKEYVGPRMSSRRLLDIASGGGDKKDAKAKPAEKPASKKAGTIQKKIDTKTKQVDRIKAQMEKTDDKAKKKELAGKAREINAEIRGLTRDMKKENTAAKRDAKKAEKAASKPQKSTELDRKVASDFRKELNEREMEGAKVQRSTKDGTMKITISKDDRTKLTGALGRLKRQMEGKLEITREMKGDKVVAIVKLAGNKGKKKEGSKSPNRGGSKANSISSLPGDRIDFYEPKHRKAVASSITDSLKEAKLGSKAKVKESGATLDVALKSKDSKVIDSSIKTVLDALKRIGKEKKARFTYRVERSKGLINNIKIYAKETKSKKSSVTRSR